MTSPLVMLAMPGNEAMSSRLARLVPADEGRLEVRRFPDGESYVRMHTSVEGRQVALICSLDDPDRKLASLLFAADLLRDLGASGVGLVAPYLAYLRQDRQFLAGEALTSRTFGRLLSAAFDWLVTVDPHLHRYGSLGEVYSIPATAVHCASLLGDWVKGQVASPFVVGPDRESEQWVAEVAAKADAPHVTFAKNRVGDREVYIDAPALDEFRGRTPVLVDDIGSSGATLVQASRLLVAAGFSKPVCLVVHPLFGDGALVEISVVASEILSTDTVEHETNQISVAGLIASAIRQFAGLGRRGIMERQFSAD